MPSRIYLDWNATTPLRPEARVAMAAAWDLPGNPSSVHAEGRQARRPVEDARASVAAAVGAAPRSVVFTSGGTEANASALMPGLRGAAGPVQLVREAAQIVHEAGGLLHTDAIQALGKIPLDIKALGADLLTVSAHKI